MDEQLPDGLQIAIQYCNMAPEQRKNFAQNAVRSEFAQRIALQQRSAEQAQRIADLEQANGMHAAALLGFQKLGYYMEVIYCANRLPEGSLGKHYGDAAVERMQAQDRRIADLEAERDKAHQDAISAAAERDELRARLAEIEAQEPVAKIHSDGYWTTRRGHDPLSGGKAFLSVYARPVPARAVPDGAIPTVVDALEFRRDQYGLEQRQWAWVLGMQPSHYSEVVAGKRSLPKAAMSMAFAHGVPAAALFQCRPNLGATDIDRRLEQMSAAAPEHKA